MDNLDKITTYLRDNHISLDNITPTTVHNVLSENESIVINEWRDLSDEQLEKLDQLDDGRYNPIVKRGDKVVIIRFNPIVPSFNGEKGFPLGGYGWVDSMEVRKALDFTELEAITNHTDYRTEPYPGDDERTYMLFAKVKVTDPENKFYKAEFRLDPEYFTWVKVEKDITDEKNDIELDEDLVNWSYNGDEIGVIKETLEEKNRDNINRMKSDNIRNMTMIPTSKRLAAEVIYGVLTSHGYGPYSPGDTINLQQQTLNGPDGYDFENRLRFDILRESLSLDKEGRGFSFEGIIAGFFGGKPAPAGLKEDIYIDGVPISVKQSNAIMNGTADAWDTGSLLGKELDGDIISGYNLVKGQIESAGLELPTELDDTTGKTKYGGQVKKNLSSFETPYALLVAGKEYDVYKRSMLETVFTSSKGVPLSWIFAGIKENGDIKYRYMSSEQLIDNILNVVNIHEVIGLGRNRENGFRIKSKPILTQESTSEIILPIVTEKELIDETYEEEGEKLIDRIANLFGDKASRVNKKAINYIKDNPTEFLDRLKVLMPELDRLTREDVNEATKRVNMLITESLGQSEELSNKKMRDRLHWWWDNEGFTLEQDILKVMGFGPNEYYNVRVEALKYLGGVVGLSEKIYDEITGLEKVDYGNHTLRYVLDDIEFYVTSGGLPQVNIEATVDPLSKYDFSTESGTITTHYIKDLGWGPDGREYDPPTNTDGIYDDIENYIISDLEAKYFDKYGVEIDAISIELGTESMEDENWGGNVDLYRDWGNSIIENSDIFGQGLLEPIEYGEYDNDEDWDRDVRGIDVDDEGKPLPTKRETSPEDMYVSPTKGIESNICNTEGFCQEQGPITFGQLKALIDTATNKRLGSDIARGGFKTIWRLVPFFLPQLLLVSAGVTITRAINKIITPALKDTRGHKSWWGKAVLKAMDIAEGDYIPDKALGDDPLSKIFFISDGLLSMLKDKYKLKFARYVSAVADSKPDNEIVPEWFVDDLLRDYLNQKFLLDPPLQTREEFKKNHITEELQSYGGLLPINTTDVISEDIEDTTVSKFITQNKYELLKIVVGDVTTEPTVWEFKEILTNYLKISDIYIQGIIWLTLRWNTTRSGMEYDKSIIETLKNVEYSQLELPSSIYKLEVDYSGEIEYDEDEEWCDEKGLGERTGDECSCKHWEIWHLNDEDGAPLVEVPCIDFDDYYEKENHPYLSGVDCECEEYATQYYSIQKQSIDTTTFLTIDDVDEDDFIGFGFDDSFGGDNPELVGDRGYWQVSSEFDTDYLNQYDRMIDEGQITGIVINGFNLGGAAIGDYLTENLVSRWVITESDGAYPFDRKELVIMKMIHNEFDQATINKIAGMTSTYVPADSSEQYSRILKIFGIDKARNHYGEDDKQNSRFAKWVSDNWNEEGEYGNLENPEKAELHWYTGTLNSTGEQVEYKSGTAEVLGWDLDDAEEEITDNFYDWGGEQETYDYGDYNEYDSEAADVKLMESVERILEERDKPRGNEEMVVGDRVMLVNMDDPWSITPYTKGTVIEVQPNDPATSPRMDMMDTKTSYVVAWDTKDGRTMKLLGGIDRWLRIDDNTLEDINENFIIDRDAGLSPDLKEGDTIIIVKNGTGVQIPLYTEFEVKKQETVEDLNYPDFNSEMLYVTNKTIYDSGGIGSVFLALTKHGNSHLLGQKDRWRRDKISWLKVNKDDTVLNEHGDDTSWANDDGKVTLQEILELTKDIPIIPYPTKELAKLPSLKKLVLGWDPEEIERINQVEVSRQYPILVMVNESNEVQWILDGNHRAQQAVMNDIPTIPAKLIKPSDLDERSIKMFYPEGIPGENQTINEHSNDKDGYGDLDVQTIVDNVYPHIVDNLGPSEYVNAPPTVEVWNDIYARLSGIPEMVGEDSRTSKSEYDEYGNMIYIYYPNMKNVGDVIKALLHEYTHSLQDPTNKEENRALGYDDDPDEIESREAELNWEEYLKYVVENLQENEEPKKSRLNPQLMVGDEILVVSSKGIHDFGSPELYKPYVVVGIKHKQRQNWEGPETDTSYYQIEPLDMTDEQRTGAMLAGGGRAKPLYIFPPGLRVVYEPDLFPMKSFARTSSDQWVLNPGFRRGELNEEDGYIDDMVYRDEPMDKHIRRMDKDLGSLEGFPIGDFKNVPPPTNESNKTEEEIEYLEDIPVDKNLVDSADEIGNYFSNFLTTKGLEFPTQELKEVMVGVKSIILKLKYHYNRPRPFQIAKAKGLELNAETLQSSSSPSYPSGHATQGRFIARYLSDLYPEYINELMQIGDDIAFSRNMAKVHYPSDSAFGKVLGDSMYDYVYQPKEELEMELDETYKRYGYDEHSKHSPVLELGDVIMVIKVDGEHEGMPEIGVEYKVSEIGGYGNNGRHDLIYDLLPTDVDCEGLMKCDYISKIKRIYRGDRWVKLHKEGDKTLQESEFNEELYKGDVIMIIKTDSDRENGETTYRTMPPELRPERHVPYIVTEKVYAGKEWSWNYTVVPQDKFEDYKEHPKPYQTHTNEHGELVHYEKLIYPWIYQWVRLEEGFGSKEDKNIRLGLGRTNNIFTGEETINEHQETQLSPELEVGDIIKVIKVDGEHARMPELFTDYKVVKASNAYPLGQKQNRNYNVYYDIVPYPVVEPSVVVNVPRKTLYQGDRWIRSWKEEIPKYIEEQKSFMDNSDQAMERARKEALRRGLLNSLETLFDVLPYEEGEIVHNNVNMGIYHKETDQFVPIDYVYDPIMENMGMEVTEADLQLFINVITEWVNISMVPDSEEEYVN